MKQLLELDGDIEMDLYLPQLSDSNVLIPLPEKDDVYNTALSLRPEIEAGKLNVESSDLSIKMARAGYLPTLSLSAGIGSTNANGSDFSFSEQVKQNWNNSLGLTSASPSSTSGRRKVPSTRPSCKSRLASWTCWTTRRHSTKPSKTSGWPPTAHNSNTWQLHRS